MTDLGSAGGLASARSADGVAWLTGRTRALLPRRDDLRTMRRRPRRDLLAGLTVAVVALPLALAFGISSGLGAGAGIAAAVIAGAVAAALGGSNLQVSGPTGAMTVVLVPIVASHGPAGVLAAGIMAGVLLVGLAYAGAGRYMRYIPVPVVEGFTLGIAIIIGLQQVPAALGVSGAGTTVLGAAVDALATWLARPSLAAPAIALGVAGTMLLAARFLPGVPVSLAAVVVATVTVQATGADVIVIGPMPAGLPAPALPAVGPGDISGLVLPAVAIAALGALESLMSATVADGMSVDERHDSDRELFGQGVANLVTPLFGGIPATAAIARTAVNVRSGAASRLAAITHAGALLVVVLVAAPWVGAIPLAALAGVLIATAVVMVETSSLVAMLRATRGDAAALLITAGATIVFDLVTAVVLGLVVAGAFALQQMARSAQLNETELDHEDHSAEERALFEEHIVAYRLDGPLFFGAAHAFLLELSEVATVRVVILRMSRLATLDATGATVLGDTIRRLEARGITVMLSGVRMEHRRVLDRMGVLASLASERHLFDHTPAAIAHARAHARRLAHLPGDPSPDAAGPSGPSAAATVGG